MSTLKSLITKIKNFRDKRNWRQFHTPRNLAESLVLEAAEVLEYFQWKSEKEAINHLKTHKAEFAYELADVLNYLILLADSTGIKLDKALESKLKLNDKKYPVRKSKGLAKKYTEL